MIIEVTRALSPRELAAVTAVIDSGDRSKIALRVDVSKDGPICSAELRPVSKAAPGHVNVSFRDGADDVVAQHLDAPKLLGDFEADFLGVTYRLRVRKAPPEPGLPATRKKPAAEKNGARPSPTPEERAARTKAYVALNCEACWHCGSTQIVKSVVIGRRCQVHCPDCNTTWFDLFGFIAVEGAKFAEKQTCESKSKSKKQTSSTTKVEALPA